MPADAPRYESLIVDGASIEFVRFGGARAGPEIVLLHEGLGCVALWRDFPARLAAASGLPVFAYSRIGYGGSAAVALPRSLEYMSLEATNTLPRVLDAAAITDFVLLGHSDGATIALVYAGRTAAPGLRAAIAIAPHVFCERLSVDSIAAVKQQFERGDLRRRLEKYHGENVDCAFRGWCDSWLDPRFSTWSVEAELAGIRVPVLQLQGRNDEYGTVAQLERIEAAAGGSVETQLLGDCGHAPHLERPAPTMRSICAFLARLGA